MIPLRELKEIREFMESGRPYPPTDCATKACFEWNREVFEAVSKRYERCIRALNTEIFTRNREVGLEETS